MMTAHLHETAPTQFIESGGIPFAYRRFGKGGTVPLVFLRYFSVMLLGTGPSGGEGMTFTELSPDEQANPEALQLAAFFTPTKTSQAAGRALIERLTFRTADRDQPVLNA